MNILIPDSWLREYLETDARPSDIQKCLSLCGPSVERMTEKDGDFIYDIEVTTNRVDCMSVIGIAREAVAILPRFGFKAKLIKNPFAEINDFKTSPTVDYLDITLDSDLCSNFSAILIKNVTIGPSPENIGKKLESVGLRSLNNVIDVSNLLCHELGQPIHTYDYDKIQGALMNLRISKLGETVTTLDGKTHKLNGYDIVINDGSNRIIDLCGIMGGELSKVDDNTKNVLLFVQTYNHLNIRKTSMNLGIRTNAAVLFEKQLPSEGVIPTLDAAADLLTSLTSGTKDKTTLSIATKNPLTYSITFSQPIEEFSSAHLGIYLSKLDISQILSSLNFKVLSDTLVEIPWYRKYDIQIPEDLVEEIARIYGYHKLPSILMSGSLSESRPQDVEFNWEKTVKQCLKYLGFTESYTYSLTPSGNGLKLLNPLSSEWTYLRTNLTDSHIAIIAENFGRIPELNFFELAKVYIKKVDDLPNEITNLIISTTNLNERRLKGIIDSISNLMGVSINYSIQKFNNPDSLIFECNFSELIKNATTIRKFTPISKFAPIIEDFNLKLDKPYNEIISHIHSLSPLIKTIELKDIFNANLTLQITFLDPSKQLTKEDITPIRQSLVSH